MIAGRPFKALTGGARRSGFAASVVWGFAEGTLFFVVPDVLISLAAVTSWRRALWQAGGAIIGAVAAVAAGALMFSWAVRAPSGARQAVGQVPFVREQMFAVAAAGLDRAPFAALLRGSFGGIPYKVFAVEAPGRVAWSRFLFASVPARALRFLVVGTGVALVATLVRRLTPLRRSGLLAATISGWVIFYSYYWLTV
ncbi:MAG: hypothetical protein ABIX37_10405 [Gammaproteobacteria bacterium]